MSKYLDTRDLQKRLEELEGYEEALKSAEQDLQDIKDEDVPEDIEEQEDLERRMEKAEDHFRSCRSDFGEDEGGELKELREMADEIPEWRHGKTLIPEDEWVDYCQQFAEDIGAVEDFSKWPCSCIDWKEAASELAHDYSTIDYQGTAYYYRA